MQLFVLLLICLREIVRRIAFAILSFVPNLIGMMEKFYLGVLLVHLS